MTFACAESCTGGLIARQMTSVAGSSEVFWGGAVTYSNESKTRFLNIPSELIAAQGAVSGAIASAMVRGMAALSGVPLAVSVTGVAGPGGGTERAPVGTVWFGLLGRRAKSGSVAVRVRFSGSRAAIQSSAATTACFLVRKWWESNMDLDSLRSLADNDGKPLIEAFEPPQPLPSNPF